MPSGRILFALLLLVALAVACDATSSGSRPGGGNTATLAHTLALLNLSNPSTDLDANLLRNDRRFVGVYGITCSAPGLSDRDAPLLTNYGINCLAGTSDADEGPEHLSLIEKAHGYAESYNTELLRRIRSGLIT